MPTPTKKHIIQDGIDFNVIPARTNVNAKIDNNGVEGSSIINAVNIDWNEAQLGETIIQSTGQMLSYLSSISTKLDELKNIIGNL